MQIIIEMRNINWNYWEYERIFKEYIIDHRNERKNDHQNEKYKLKLSKIWKNIQEIYD